MHENERWDPIVPLQGRSGVLRLLTFLCGKVLLGKENWAVGTQ